VGPRVSPDVVGKRQNLLVLPGFEPDSSNMQSVKESYGFYFHPPFFLIIFPHLRLRPCPPPPISLLSLLSFSLFCFCVIHFSEKTFP